ncbi:hypothetical protein L6452_31510 [Arctium lappa]|uniref:Uncharacterized protein n=1 Tax=Arctium lappa TaxID=4217 RepID=A0ACB8Z273_ARCLA|nr:hypothetical protein L6452_31510 [Arctium lappa]
MADATTNSTTQQPPPPPQPSSSPPPESTESTAAKMVNKRFEGLMMVRTKAIKGKGAWYWTHLEPILVRNSGTGVPESVKLRCSLCGAVFSASNPSRTAAEHLKRGTCPNFNSDPNPNPNPISAFSPAGASTTSFSPQRQKKHRKRNSGATTYSVAPLTMIEPDTSYPTRPDSFPALPAPAISGSGLYSQHHHHHSPAASPASTAAPPAATATVILSGGKEDLSALAMFEDSVKKLKTPKSSPKIQTLTKPQIDSSIDLLTDWAYENCGSISFSSFDHPKFKTFLNRLGLPAITRRDFARERLDSKYRLAKSESEARIRDAMFFQASSNGWRSNDGHHYNNNSSGELENPVNLSVNLPNGTSVFRRAVFTNGYVFSKDAEAVLWETIVEICGSNLRQCVGIVSDKFKSKALKNLENQHQWMINLCCQFQGVNNLIKDFNKELPLFKNVIDNCVKVSNFVNTRSQIRTSFLKNQIQESGRARLIRVPFTGIERFGFEPVFGMIQDILSSARSLQLVLLDENYRKVSIDDDQGREIEEIIRNPRFWRELEAVTSLVKLVKGMAHEIENERPRIGQCLPLWEELRVKIKDWCLKFQINENHVDKVFDKRFKRNYHPAWAAAFILDPFYLIRDRSGKYLPPFKCLTPDQEKDVDKLITRLVSREEAHIALMELMKWRTEGLDPVYAQAVQLKQRDPVSGKMKIANPQSSRLVWETYLTDFNSLRKVAVRLIFLHATSCGFKWNWSFSRLAQFRNGIEKAEKLIFIAANSRLERRDSSNDDDKDAEFFAVANGDDDMLNEVLFDASSP